MRTVSYDALCRKAVPEGIVLLENDGTLPLHKNDRVALFGRGQFEYVMSGTGSGGRVYCKRPVNLHDALDTRVRLDTAVSGFFADFIAEHPFDSGDGWALPASQVQPMLDEAFVAEAATRADKAIFVLCRQNGEGKDVEPKPGAWYLREEEEQSIALIAKHFKNFAVLVNGGNLIDLLWIKKYNVGAVAYIWQGGQEGGVGTADALMGEEPPSGRLTDTVALSLEDHPAHGNFGDPDKNIHKEDVFVGYRYFETFAQDKVLYPFGYGLGYTTFSQRAFKARKNGNTITFSVTVKNTGAYKGKDVVQVYYAAPQGTLGRPARELIAYKKTDMLSPGQSQTLEFSVDARDMAAYDDSGASGHAYAYVLEKGAYRLFAGQSVRAATLVYSFVEPFTRVVRQCKQALAPTEPFDRMCTRDGKKPVWEKAPAATYAMQERAMADVPELPPVTGWKGIVLNDVKRGKKSVRDFVAQFEPEMLCSLVRGEGMSSVKAPMPGTAACMGGTTRVWQMAGVPVVSLCDGPSGVRLECPLPATCIPSGTLLACCWAPELLEGLFDGFAAQMRAYKADVILAPAVNIHRYPLCGRNFEYFSEDPYLAGSTAAAISSYFAKNGVFCTLKHFAVNGQENNRKAENEVVSERALREIYLRPFEIAVRSGTVQSVMTSYNRINGVSASANYDLTTTVLRGEWGYDGFVMTDWWAEMDEDGTHAATNLAAMVRAQNDIFMVTEDALTYRDNLAASLRDGKLHPAQLRRCAENIISFICKTPACAAKDKPADVNAPDLTVVYQTDAQDGKASVTVPQAGVYAAELTLCVEGDARSRHTVKICVDDREATMAVLGGSEGKPKAERIRLALQKNSVLHSLSGAALEKVRILGDKNGKPIV